MDFFIGLAIEISFLALLGWLFFIYRKRVFLRQYSQFTKLEKLIFELEYLYKKNKKPEKLKQEIENLKKLERNHQPKLQDISTETKELLHSSGYKDEDFFAE